MLSFSLNPHPVARGQTEATISSSPLHTPDPIAPLPDRPLSESSMSVSVSAISLREEDRLADRRQVERNQQSSQPHRQPTNVSRSSYDDYSSNGQGLSRADGRRPDVSKKLVVVGDGGCGKTCLLTVCVRPHPCSRAGLIWLTLLLLSRYAHNRFPVVSSRLLIL